MVDENVLPQSEASEDPQHVTKSRDDNPENDLNSRASLNEPGEGDPGPSPEQQNSEVKGKGVNPSMQPPKKGPDKQKKRMFGLVQEKFTNHILSDDYEAKYPPDQMGHEMGPNARVWRVYLDEAELNDRDMVESWKDGIDILLVFAGLFSAVVTTLATQTSQKLDEDYGPISAALLAEIIAIQRTVAAGGLVSEVPAAVPGLNSRPRYTSADIWVNALWFTSLTLSLVTALSAVLIKQWIQHYVSFVSGTAQERARIHQFRYAGLEKWGVRGIMSVLPVLLYAALSLFILGLVIFLQALKTEIAIVVGVIGGIAFFLYVVTNGLPLFYPQCPYYTPLIEIIRTATKFSVFTYRQIRFYIKNRAIPRFLLASHHTVSYLHARFGKQIRPMDWNMSQRLQMSPPNYEPAAHKLSESQAAISDQDKLTEDIIRWLLTMSSNPSVKPIALQSISGLRPGFSRIHEFLGNHNPASKDFLSEKYNLVRNELYNELERQGSISINKLPLDDPIALMDSPLFYTVERTLRAYLFVPVRYFWEGWDGPIWNPYKWEVFDETVTNLEDGVPLAFKQALATYRIHSNRYAFHDSSAQAKLSPLSSLVGAAKDSPALWHAWAHGFQRVAQNDTTMKRVPHSTPEAYIHFRPLFKELLSGNQFDIIFPFLRQALPHNLVEEYFGHPLEQGLTASEQLEIKQVNFATIILQCVIAEWDEDQRLERSSRTETEALIIDISRLYANRVTVCSDAARAQRRLLAVLNELPNHPNFLLSQLKSSTYSAIFAVYERADSHSANEAPTTSALFSSREGIHAILATQNCVYGLWDILFDPSYTHKHCLHVPYQVISALEGEEVSDQMVQNAFDAFLEPYLVKQYSVKDTFPGERASVSQWPPVARPIVRWTLDYIMAHSGTENCRASVDALAANLIERPGFLTFTCSSFLIAYDGRYHTVKFGMSRESDVLLRLADYHKNKPEAAAAWRHFLSWIQDKSNDSYNHEHLRRWDRWTREDFEGYGRVADFVDQLANYFEFNDPAIKIPRFEESYITNFLKSKGQTPDTSESEPAATGRPSTKTWSSLLHKLLTWGGHSGAIGNTDVAGNIDLESNQKEKESDS